VGRIERHVRGDPDLDAVLRRAGDGHALNAIAMHLPRRRRAPAVLLALLLAASPAAAQARAAVTFSVFAAETQAALPGARVSVDGRARGVADARGEVRVDGISAGTHRATVSLQGRVPRTVRLELGAGEERDVLVLLEPLAVQLRGITAAARARSRDARIELGRFVTRAQIEERNAVHFTDLFRGVAGVMVTPGPAGETIRSQRAVSMMGGFTDCPPQFFVDGFPYVPDGSSLDAQFPVAEIEGVEMYFGNVPAQWGGSKALCGVVLVWTRTNAAPAGGTR
jgi:TonB-dependent receptor-like protein